MDVLALLKGRRIAGALAAALLTVSAIPAVMADEVADPVTTDPAAIEAAEGDGSSDVTPQDYDQAPAFSDDGAAQGGEGAGAADAGNDAGQADGYVADGDGVQSGEGDGAAAADGDGIQTDGGDGIQPAADDAPQAFEGDGVQPADGDDVQAAEGDGAQTDEGDGTQLDVDVVEGDGAQTAADAESIQPADGDEAAEGTAALSDDVDGVQLRSAPSAPSPEPPMPELPEAEGAPKYVTDSLSVYADPTEGGKVVIELTCQDGSKIELARIEQGKFKLTESGYIYDGVTSPVVSYLIRATAAEGYRFVDWSSYVLYQSGGSMCTIAGGIKTEDGKEHRAYYDGPDNLPHGDSNFDPAHIPGEVITAEPSFSAYSTIPFEWSFVAHFEKTEDQPQPAPVETPSYTAAPAPAVYVPQLVKTADDTQAVWPIALAGAAAVAAGAGVSATRSRRNEA